MSLVYFTDTDHCFVAVNSKHVDAIRQGTTSTTTEIHTVGGWTISVEMPIPTVVGMLRDHRDGVREEG